MDNGQADATETQLEASDFEPGQFEALTTGDTKPPVGIEDVYNLLAEVFERQGQIQMQQNALVQVVNSVIAKVPEFMAMAEQVSQLPMFKMFAKFLPKSAPEE